MNQRLKAILGALSIAFITVACGPNDASLSARVKSNLSADAAVKSAPIDVGVQNKVVTLSGTVDSLDVKQGAVAAARKTEGVADVIDQITVKDQGSSAGPGHGREMMQRGMDKGMKMEGKEHPKL